MVGRHGPAGCPVPRHGLAAERCSGPVITRTLPAVLHTNGGLAFGQLWRPDRGDLRATTRVAMCRVRTTVQFTPAVILPGLFLSASCRHHRGQAHHRRRGGEVDDSLIQG